MIISLALRFKVIPLEPTFYSEKVGYKCGINTDTTNQPFFPLVFITVSGLNWMYIGGCLAAFVPRH